MFDLSLVEMLFVAVVTLVVVGPKDLPKLLRAVLGLFKQVREAWAEMRGVVDDMVDESGMKEVREEVRYIVDQNGKMQKTYDIDDFLEAKPSVSGDKKQGETDDSA